MPRLPAPDLRKAFGEALRRIEAQGASAVLTPGELRGLAGPARPVVVEDATRPMEPVRGEGRFTAFAELNVL
jgi:hypothetical protein